MNYKNILKSWGLKFLGVGLLILILTKTNTGEIFNTVKQFNAFQILWIEVLSLLIILSKSIRFKNILSLYNVTVSLQENILIYGSGMYLSTITPGRFGDFSKIFYLKHYTGCDYKKGLYINILDRLFDLTILLLTSLIGLFWNFFKLVIYSPMFFFVGRIISAIAIGVALYFIMHLRFGLDDNRKKLLVAIIYPGSLFLLGLLTKGTGL